MHLSGHEVVNDVCMHVVFATKPHRYVTMSKALMRDAQRCAEGLEGFRTSSVEQFWARTFVRSFFALVEACTHELKVIVCEAASKGAIELSDAERSALSDESYDVDAKGRVVARPRFIPIERKIRLVHSMLHRLFGPELALPASDHRYAAFKTAITIRNRITHPKSVEETAITNSEIETILLAAAWYGDVQQSLIQRWSAVLDD